MPLLTIEVKEGIIYRDIRTRQFLLTCPKCTAVKNTARCTLFDSHARVVYCSRCHTSTTSSLWHCSHNISWLLCPSHREAGFRCAGHRKPRHAKTSLAYGESKLKAKFQRLNRLGLLGQAKAKDSNSISAAGMPKQKTKNRKNEIKTTKSGGMQRDRPSILCSGLSSEPKKARTLSVYGCFLAGAPFTYPATAARIAINKVEGDRQHGNISNHCNPGIGGKESSASSAKTPVCISQARGGCPTSWTIHNYCEACHG